MSIPQLGFNDMDKMYRRLGSDDFPSSVFWYILTLQAICIWLNLRWRNLGYDPNHLQLYASANYTIISFRMSYLAITFQVAFGTWNNRHSLYIVCVYINHNVNKFSLQYSAPSTIREQIKQIPYLHGTYSSFTYTGSKPQWLCVMWEDVLLWLEWDDKTCWSNRTLSILHALLYGVDNYLCTS